MFDEAQAVARAYSWHYGCHDHYIDAHCKEHRNWAWIAIAILGSLAVVLAVVSVSLYTDSGSTPSENELNDIKTKVNKAVATANHYPKDKEDWSSILNSWKLYTRTLIDTYN